MLRVTFSLMMESQQTAMLLMTPIAIKNSHTGNLDMLRRVSTSGYKREISLMNHPLVTKFIT